MIRLFIVLDGLVNFPMLMVSWLLGNSVEKTYICETTPMGRRTLVFITAWYPPFSVIAFKSHKYRIFIHFLNTSLPCYGLRVNWRIMVWVGTVEWAYYTISWLYPQMSLTCHCRQRYLIVARLSFVYMLSEVRWKGPITGQLAAPCSCHLCYFAAMVTC